MGVELLMLLFTGTESGRPTTNMMEGYQEERRTRRCHGGGTGTYIRFKCFEQFCGKNVNIILS